MPVTIALCSDDQLLNPRLREMLPQRNSRFGGAAPALLVGFTAIWATSRRIDLAMVSAFAIQIVFVYTPSTNSSHRLNLWSKYEMALCSLPRLSLSSME